MDKEPKTGQASMASKEKQIDKRAELLRVVYLELWKCPGCLNSFVNHVLLGDIDEADIRDSFEKYIKSLRIGLSIGARWPEVLSVRQNPIIVEEIRRLLRFISENRLEVGWRFVQLADWKQEARGSWKGKKRVFTELVDSLGISDNRWDYVREFAYLMVGQAAHLELLLLSLSPPVFVPMSHLEEDAVLIGPTSDNYALKGLVCNIKNTARHLRNYCVPDEGRKEISVAKQVLDFWDELDKAKHLLVHCKGLLEPELYKQAQVTLNVLWDYKEEIVFQFTYAIEVPSSPAEQPMSMRSMIEAVSSRFAKANERRILLEELAGQLEVALETKDKRKDVKVPTEGTEAIQKTKSKIKTRKKRPGRKKKFTDEQLRQMCNLHEQHYQKSGDSKAAWHKTAKFYALPSGKAAEMHCIRYKKKENK